MRSKVQFYETGTDGNIAFDSPARELLVDELVLAVEWAPDSSKVATFTMGEGGASINVHEFATGEWKTLTNPEISLAQLEALPKILSWAR